MSRINQDFLRSYIKYTDRTESALLYNIWCGVSCLSAALQRKVWTTLGGRELYPNQYIILIGSAGTSRKSSAIYPANELISHIKIPITAANITREALIRNIQEVPTYYTVGGINYIQNAIASVNSELRVLLGQGNIAFLTLLTDWWDSPAEWVYRTKGAGIDAVKNLCFNLLGGATPEGIRSSLSTEAVSGGFTSRVIFVYSSGKRQTILDTELSQEEIRLRESLKRDLARIATLTGQFKKTKDYIMAWNAWYQEYSDNPPNLGRHFSNYMGRRPAHLVKLAMALSVSRSNDLVLDVQDFLNADQLLTTTESIMHKVFAGFGENRLAGVIEDIHQIFVSGQPQTRNDLCDLFWERVNSDDLDVCIQTLMNRGIIEFANSTSLQITEKGRREYSDPNDFKFLY